MSKIILITGGSQGIGAATAMLASAEGYTVCINYLQNHEAANAIVTNIRKQGGEAHAFQADVAEEREVERMFSTIDKNVGRVTALANNAGIVAKRQRVSEMTAERLHKMFDTNVIGSFLCAREAIKRMSAKNGGAGGAVVNISSVASRLGSAFEYVDYAASKGAIDAFTIGLSKEVAEENIRVNAVRPGITYTDIHAKGGEPDRPERMKGNIPMKRPGQPDEIAKTILWLLSDDASYITGAIVDVSGGR